MPDAGPVDPPPTDPPADFIAGFELNWRLDFVANVPGYDFSNLDSFQVSGLLGGRIANWNQLIDAQGDPGPNLPVVVVFRADLTVYNAVSQELIDRFNNAYGPAAPNFSYVGGVSYIDLPDDRAVSAPGPLGVVDAVEATQGAIGAVPPDFATEYFGLPALPAVPPPDPNLQQIANPAGPAIGDERGINVATTAATLNFSSNKGADGNFVGNRVLIRLESLNGEFRDFDYVVPAGSAFGDVIDGLRIVMQVDYFPTESDTGDSLVVRGILRNPIKRAGVVVLRTAPDGTDTPADSQPSLGGMGVTKLKYDKGKWVK